MLHDIINSLPQLPGCYIYRNRHGDVIYVGKSKRLKNRVRQYFQSLDKKDDKLRRLVAEIADIEYIVTENETEALILEHKLIRKFWPKYNSQMKNNRSYPFLRIDVPRELPGISVSASIKSDGAEYFGCFRNTNSAEDALALISEVWKTPTCGKPYFDPTGSPSDNNKRACLRYHLGKCAAPCDGSADGAGYKNTIEEIVKFLKGSDKEVLRRLRREMRQAAGELRFERAAGIKTAIAALERLESKARRFNTALAGKDFILFIRAFNEQGFSVYYIEDGDVRLHRRCDGVEVMPEDTAAEFANAVIGRQRNVDDGTLARGLTDILADKLYVEVKPQKKKPKPLLELILKCSAEFI